MPSLPDRPDLDHLRHQAKDLLRAASDGDAAACGRIDAVSGRLTLASAQLAIAREYGFASWARLKAEVDARTTALAEQARAFCVASIEDWAGSGARILEANPQIAGYDFATALVLGDLARVREEIGRDPGLVSRPDPESGWAPLHVVSSSRWHQMDPARADGLTAVARFLLESGADPSAKTLVQHDQGDGEHDDDGRSALRCAAASASAGVSNRPVIQLLLDSGAVPDDHDLYLAGFATDAHQCLPLLLDHIPNVTEIAVAALAAPISAGDTESVRILLDAGADPNRYWDEGDKQSSAVHAAVLVRCPLDLVELLLDHGADPNVPGPDGWSPYRVAINQGRSDLAALLLRHGARDDATDTDRFLAACLDADRAEVERQLAEQPGLVPQLGEDEYAAIVEAATVGNTAAVGLMLDIGFPVDSPGRDDGGTALHAGAYSGSAASVRLLLERGANIEARHATWDITPLMSAIVGSRQRSRNNPNPDWVATVQALLDAGASIRGITLSPNDHKEVAQLLHGYGVPSK